MDLGIVKKCVSKLRSKLKNDPLSKPSRIAIELTNRCNLNCPFCLVGMQKEQSAVAHDDLNRPFGTMEMSLVDKIIIEAKQFGIRDVMLTFQGEPLLHKQFVDVIRTSKKFGLKSHVFTNGLLLNPDLSRQIVREGLDSMRFSVDGISEKTYQLNRVGGRFEKVYQNMVEMVRIVREEKSKIELMWQFIALSNNEHEIEDAKKMAKQIGIPIYIKTFAESMPELAPSNPKYRRRLQVKPCTDIYQAVYVYWNGDVVPCCYDVEGKEIMGNIAENTLKEIWNNEKYISFRKQADEAVRHPEKESHLCRNCQRWTLPG